MIMTGEEEEPPAVEPLANDDPSPNAALSNRTANFSNVSSGIPDSDSDSSGYFRASTQL